ncbi:hypothetical protein NKR23_g10721 [Pleurostoma richardsiae]|uniref:WSC domain-containing protein n=1 Tax=Pleurostoma richardsiae TaxID=41990 RepID=A0AA38R4N9_9PEZI|nr:hypothetical protein NKR23_g10721 [Pleurostoma richardsiae]
MTPSACAAACESSSFFGLSAGRICYCGDFLQASSSSLAESLCTTPCAGDNTQTCGSSSALSLYAASGHSPYDVSPSILPSAGSYKFDSCRTDLNGDAHTRALDGPSYASSSMTVEACSDFCYGFGFFGVGNGRECICGSSIDATSASVPDSECDFNCEGASSEFCGAAGRINLYTLSTTSSSSTLSTVSATSAVSSSSSSQSTSASSFALSLTNTIASSSIASYTSASTPSSADTSMVTSSTSSSALAATSTSAPTTSTSSTTSSTISVALCTTTSTSMLTNGNFADGTTAGWTITGGSIYAINSPGYDDGSSMLVTGQCPLSGCGTQLSVSQTVQLTSGSQYVFKAKAMLVSSTGSYITLHIIRPDGKVLVYSMLSQSGNPVGSWIDLSVSIPASDVNADGSYTINPWFVNLWTKDLRFDNMRLLQVKTAACPQTISSSSTYSSSIITSTTSSLSSSIISTSTASSSTATASSTAPAFPSVSGYDFVSCWTESSSGRALSGATTASDDMTLEACAGFCSSWSYFGVEYGRECYCGSSVASDSAAAEVSECSFSCAGDASERCGAGLRLSLYHNTDKANPQAPAVISGYDAFACVTESAAGRTLYEAATASDTMTLEACADFCEGYTFFGAEYGRECYCGNELRDGSEIVGAAECGMVCAGDSSELCGAANRLTVYQVGAV